MHAKKYGQMSWALPKDVHIRHANRCYPASLLLFMLECWSLWPAYSIDAQSVSQCTIARACRDNRSSCTNGPKNLKLSFGCISIGDTLTNGHWSMASPADIGYKGHYPPGYGNTFWDWWCSCISDLYPISGSYPLLVSAEDKRLLLVSVDFKRCWFARCFDGLGAWHLAGVRWASVWAGIRWGSHILLRLQGYRQGGNITPGYTLMIRGLCYCVTEGICG